MTSSFVNRVVNSNILLFTKVSRPENLLEGLVPTVKDIGDNGTEEEASYRMDVGWYASNHYNIG